MPLDPDALRGTALPAFRTSWNEDDVILYHLALGAGDPPTDLNQQALTFEQCLSVLPTFSSIAAQRDHRVLLDLPAMDVDINSVLHGEQRIDVFEPLPACGDVEISSTVVDVIDKGKAALVILETDTRDLTGQVLCRNRSSIFLPGEGGFSANAPTLPSTGTDRGAGGVHSATSTRRGPDLIVRRTTLPQQALLYRLTGDKALLHVDPEVAESLGFDRPILHGLCTFGIACLAVVNEVLDGDVKRIGTFGSRFAAPVYPGETLEVAIWTDEPTFRISVTSVDRGIEVLSQGTLTIR